MDIHLLLRNRLAKGRKALQIWTQRSGVVIRLVPLGIHPFAQVGATHSLLTDEALLGFRALDVGSTPQSRIGVRLVDSLHHVILLLVFTLFEGKFVLVHAHHH